MSADIDVASRAARYLVTTVASIRALPPAGAGDAAVDRLSRELSENYSGASAAIRAVAVVLRRARTGPVRLGDIVAPAAHEAALAMVLALNRDRFAAEVEVVGRSRKGKGTGPTVNERMGALLQADPTRMGLSASEWAAILKNELGRSVTAAAVKQTATWNQVIIPRPCARRRAHGPAAHQGGAAGGTQEA